MNDFEKYIKKALTEDSIGFEADPAIQRRLQHDMLINASRSKPYNNSFANIIITLFTPRKIALKAFFIGLCIFSIFWFGNFNQQTYQSVHIDTTSIVKTIIFDTTAISEDPVKR